MTRQPSPAELCPGRIGMLPKLPVFLDLGGKRAVVAAEGPGAAWKAELLAAAGAHVEVFAPEASVELLALAGGVDGMIRLLRRRWRAADLDRAAIAVGDFATEAEGEAFAAAARARCVPVNVIDRPASCDFQFGAIVNRAPIVVAISTDAAAPVLGQAIRRRIEAILPSGLGAWGAAAQAFRARLADILPLRAARRRFWESFVDLAFGDGPDGGTARLERLAEAVREGESGGEAGGILRIGVSSDDPELLTLKAVRMLQAADVIAHDPRIGPAILELGRREAARIRLDGRVEGGRPEATIPDRLAGLAAGGRRVVWLAREARDPHERSGIPVRIAPAADEWDMMPAGEPPRVPALS